ncbi:MAG: type 1 periplasmic binding fold superfamily protein [Deltaproteobacteria bacterium]|nr:type 1 periplasmic binding fold superfamily protein [Deltaproteobacteria bacterium]
MRFLLLLSVFAACGDDGPTEEPPELITTVILDFVPMGGGATVTAAFTDPDGDGGDPPTIDPIDLAASMMYTTGVRFQNGLETPPEEITEEIRDESDEHQVFFTGTSIDGALVHSYLDMDANGLPIGLANRFVAARGTGTLIVTLRHLPPVNDNPIKTADLAAQVKAGGFAAIGGSSDAQVTFMVTVP